MVEQNAMKNPEFYKLAGFPTGERFMGVGLVTDTNTERWKHRRSLYNPGFHREYKNIWFSFWFSLSYFFWFSSLKTYMQEFNSKGDILMEYLRKSADGKTVVSLLEEFNRTSLDVIASVSSLV